MNLRNLANKLLALGVWLTCLVLALSPVVAIVPVSVTPTAANLANFATKNYYLDAFNLFRPSYQNNLGTFGNDSILSTLGIKDYNQYLMNLSAIQALNDVVVAVVDTGLDADHPVFDGRVSEYGIDFGQGLTETMWDSWATDENGHGTHVAGLIADCTLPNVTILPIRIFAGAGNQTMDKYAFENAVRYLKALKTGDKKATMLDSSGKASKIAYNPNGVKLNILVANLSLGTEGFLVNYANFDDSEFKKYKNGYTENGVRYSGYQDTIDLLLNAQILPIVAAGNIDTEKGENMRFYYYSLPAACDGVLSVGAYDTTQKTLRHASEYSYQNDHISLAAPGTAIWSACSDDLIALVDWDQATKHNDDVSGSYYQYEHHYTYYQYDSLAQENKLKTGKVIWRIRQGEDGNYYFRSTGTSMAAPYVTACYAMLLSDTSRTTAADFGLSSWESNEGFMNVEHKALLASAKTYADFGTTGYDWKYGYGGVNVLGFISDAANAGLLNGEHQQNNVLDEVINEIPSSDRPNPDTESDEWQQALWILVGIIAIVWGINLFRPRKSQGGD